MSYADSLVYKSNSRLETLDKTSVAGTVGEYMPVTVNANKKSKPENKKITSKTDYNSILLKQSIIDGYQSVFSKIWGAVRIRSGAIRGQEIIYRRLLTESFNTYVAESASSEVSKLVSVATTTSIKQPTYESQKYKNNQDANAAIDIPNKYVDVLFYDNIGKFTALFEDGFEGGISFLHVDSQFIKSSGININNLSPYNCIWDISVPSNEISSKGSFFFIESFENEPYVKELFRDSELNEYSMNKLKAALKTVPSLIDTFPNEETELLLLNDTFTINDLEIVSIFKNEAPQVKPTYQKYRRQLKDSSRSGLHKVTVLYSRNKNNTIDKIIFINDSFVSAVCCESEYIPIVACAPLERQVYTEFQDKYASVYDNIKGELKQLAILHTSIANCAQNSANNSIFIDSSILSQGFMDPALIKNNVLPVKSSAGVPISESISQMNNPGMPPGTVEAITMAKMSISQKLNILTQESAAKSAQQEQLRIDNQVRLSSRVLESLDSSIMQFGVVMKEAIKNILLVNPEIIEKVIPIELGEIDAASAMSINSFIKDARVVLIESEYYTTQGEKDLQKLERISSIAGDSISIPFSVLLEAVNASSDTVNAIRKAEESVSSEKNRASELEMMKIQLQIKKEEALIAKANAEAAKAVAESQKKVAETNEINSNIDKDNGKEDKTIESKNNKNKK